MIEDGVEAVLTLLLFMPSTLTVSPAISIVVPGLGLGICFARRQTVPTLAGVSRPLPGWKSTSLSSRPSLRGTTSSEVTVMMLSVGPVLPVARWTSAAPPTKPVGTLLALTSMCWSAPLLAASASFETVTLTVTVAPRSSQYFFVAWIGCWSVQASWTDDWNLVRKFVSSSASGPPWLVHCHGLTAAGRSAGGSLLIVATAAAVSALVSTATALPEASSVIPARNRTPPLRLMFSASAPGSYSTSKPP